ncbi:MAG TPA: HD domain-containing phosphohydrolase [Albitalea sp.]|nr:HD domain-containing phosphohydrolase [Albitalea sp.]
MQFCALSTVKQRITLGVPLPFNVRDNDHTLLLARGQIITSASQLNELFERGALVDTDELRRPGGSEILEAPAETLPAMWGKCADRLTLVLRNPSQADFIAALDEASKPVLSLIERDPDLAIYQVVRQDASGMRYGATHSLHAAIACNLAAQRLGWDRERIELLQRAALTMNLSMLELQGRLATQSTPPTAAQRAVIHDHPLRSVEILQAAGVTDPDWLEAVAHHHEDANGAGYPHKISEVGEMAALLHRADVFTAKLSPRATRAALAANQAARQMFLQDQRHPMTAAIVKEFGIYPPGCCVKLASGEIGVVVKRGETANTPIVATLVNRHSEQMMEPLRRNTSAPEHAIVEVVSEKWLRVRISPERLVTLGA